MPFRAAPYAGRCVHCREETSMACVRCAHHVCARCEQRHDEQYAHKDYAP